MLKRTFLTTLFSTILASVLWAQPQEVSLDSALYRERAPVSLEGDTLFFLYDNINGITAGERASLVELRLRSIVEEADFEADSFRVVDHEGYSIIMYRGHLVANITLKDAQWYGSNPEALAQAWSDEISRRTSEIHFSLDIRQILTQVGLAILVLLIAGLIIKYVNRLFRVFGGWLIKLRGTYITGVKIRNYELLNEERLISFLLLIHNVLRIVFLLIIFYLTLPVVLKIFPWTEPIADKLFGFILNPLKAIFKSFVAYIPNLFTILVIFGVIRYVTKGVRYLAEEIKSEKLKITDFYSDWAVPTARIINFMLYAFMLVLIWPYLPGSDSAVFQGVSVFLGLLLTLGSSSAIANIVSGVVITYMRPYQIGHRVKIGDISGDVVEKNLLVTRIKTIKNELITVPNSTILAGSSINYSASSENSEGLIINTSVTIGYDVPWRKVHQMLIGAAKKTPLIEKHPEPFVLQTSLDDFYVSYQVNAYTHAPQKQAVIYSDLHALIQDVFAKNEVEIMSPHYRANREGPNTIPPKNSA